MEYSKLASGLQIVSEHIPHVRTVTLGFWVRVGTFSESAAEAGLSHFLEHMFFKGTGKRTAREIVEAFDDVGGEVNAYTTKEYTCFYAKVIDEHLPLAIDVLLDMLSSPAFTEKDIAKEKQVVLEEIAMYEDSPDELIHDDLAHTIWPSHPLGKPVLGSKASIASIELQDVRQYYDRYYTPANIIVSAAGNLSHANLEELIEKHARFLTCGEKTLVAYPEISYGQRLQSRVKETEQLHMCLGFPGLPWGHKDIYVMNMLNNIFGGGMSSRLFQAVREDLGLAYNIYSYSSSFIPAGYYAVYAGLSYANLPQVLQTIGTEMRLICDNPVTPAELERAKQQVKGALVIGLESTVNRMSRMGRGLLLLDKVTPLDEIVSRIEAVTVESIQELANEVFAAEEASMCLLGSVDDSLDLQGLLINSLR